MSLFNKIVKKEEKLSVVGLGYVGMPIAVEFAKHVSVIGFDVNKEKVQLYKDGIDPTNEVGNDAIRNTTIDFTCDETKLKEAKFHIVAVPTPINYDKTPNLTPLIKASEVVGRNLTQGSIVVYESTVYPGTTEEICLPILEKESGLKFQEDFFIGYSPERINPGDKVHTLPNIVKVVSGCNEEILKEVSDIYSLIIKAGVHEAKSIKIAEASKIIENSQRDVNIAFMNELAMVFDKMNIDTKAVLDAASTKWNFMNFKPGLVGGHCIGVDPYYLTYKAEELGYHSQIISAGRKINDDMGKYVAEKLIRELIKANKRVKGSKVGILGVTFKENCPDIRNSKVIDVIKELESYGINIVAADGMANVDEVKKEYGFTLVDIEDINSLDALVIAVAHNTYKELSIEQIEKMFINEQSTYLEIAATIDECNKSNDTLIEKKVIFDIKDTLDKDFIVSRGYEYVNL